MIRKSVNRFPEKIMMRQLVLAAIAASILCTPRTAIAADYAPIDCTKATTPADATICKTYALGQAEARMATLFSISTSLVAMGQRGEIMDDQQPWLKRREACATDVGCLTQAYADRIQQLNTIIMDIAAHGPY
jgi:uncharacterized protein